MMPRDAPGMPLGCPRETAGREGRSHTGGCHSLCSCHSLCHSLTVPLTVPLTLPLTCVLLSPDHSFAGCRELKHNYRYITGTSRRWSFRGFTHSSEKPEGITHSLTRVVAHSDYSLTHLLVHSLAHSLTHARTHSLTNSRLTDYFTHSHHPLTHITHINHISHSLTHSLPHPSTHSLTLTH